MSSWKWISILQSVVKVPNFLILGQTVTNSKHAYCYRNYGAQTCLSLKHSCFIQDQMQLLVEKWYIILKQVSTIYHGFNSVFWNLSDEKLGQHAALILSRSSRCCSKFATMIKKNIFKNLIYCRIYAYVQCTNYI